MVSLKSAPFAFSLHLDYFEMFKLMNRLVIQACLKQEMNGTCICEMVDLGDRHAPLGTNTVLYWVGGSGSGVAVESALSDDVLGQTLCVMICLNATPTQSVCTIK